MKKRKLVYVGAVAVGLSLSACSDSFLDMNNYGAYDDFNSETKVTWYLAGLYSNYYNTYNSPVQELVGSWGSTDWTYMTDEEWGIRTGTKIDPNSSYGTIDDIKSWEVSSGKYEDPMLSGYFGDRLGSSVRNNAYTRIRNCNILLRDIDNATVSTETKQRAKGQALFLRAVQLFDLVRIYGPVPIVTEVINAEATDNGLPRSSVTQCVSQIVKDLNEAAGYLPASWNGNDAGRPTRLTALAYKSRVLLFYASPIFNKHWDDPTDTRWKKALAAAQNALAEAGDGGVASATEWGSVLGNDDNLVNANARKEAIFVKLLTTDFSADGAETNRWESRVRLTSQQGGGGKAVPMELIDEFPMADGTRPKAKDRIANGNLRFVENRDPRFYQTFAFSGMKWGYAENKEHVAWNYRWRTQDAKTNSFAYSDGNQVASPAFVRKMSNIQTPSDGSYAASGIDLYEYRYAELVLNLAECYAATGDLQKCKETIAILRRRVGIPEGSSCYGLDETVKELDDKQELFETRIRVMYENGDTTYMEVLLSSENFSDMLSHMEIVSQIMDYDKKVVEEYKALKLSIEQQKASLESDRKEQQDYADDLKVAYQEIEAQKKEYKALKAKVDSNIELKKAEAERMLREQEQINDEIAELSRKEAAAASSSGGGGGGKVYSGSMTWPCPSYNRISSPYGYRTHPISGTRKLHKGLDISASSGNPVIAAASGTVVKSYFSSSYGNYVVISHGGGVMTAYAHMTRRLVSAGQRVAAGQQVGTVGSTGNSTGPHLHFEVYVGGSTVNPMNYFN